ncbi:Lrp/AsnC family transcriptional regulator [Ruminococcaceae bacterium OttesenSCG-928-I18]|nr:Lrp/AsnC family transcriptional regulator [Ruminococcaceae bacterium OttesenSCG-928-I18]
MDELDRHILQLLKENARMTVKEIASRVALTSPAVSERIRRMENRGVIIGYTVRLNDEYDQSKINAIISTSVPIEDRAAFRVLLDTQEDIMRCFHVTGTHSYMIRVRCENIASLEHLLGQLQTVGQTNTQIILSDMPVAGPRF